MLEATNIHANYGHSRILRGVDLRIPSGASVGLLGRNGMGKTTLIRTLMGYIAPSEGIVRIAGVDRTGATPETIARSGVAYVPEGRGIFPNLTVRENLIMTERAGPTGQRTWTLARVLEMFPRLQQRLQHGGQQLSGGEQQMLSIGRALMTNPQLLILDEATEGLAPLIVREIWDVIVEIRGAGIATLIVDRDWRRVLQHSDAIVVLEKGRVVLSEASEEIQKSPHRLAPILGV